MELSKLKSLAAADTAEIRLGTPVTGFFPYYDIMSRVSTLAVARSVVATSPNGNSHLVTIAYREVDDTPDVAIWCGDRFSEAGKLADAEAKERIKEASQGLPNAQRIASQMRDLFFGKFPASQGCNFWTKWRGSEELCKHTATVLARLRVQEPDFVEDLKAQYQAATASSAAAGQSAGEGFTLATLAFKVPVLFEGDRGSGKTMEGREFARANQYRYVELPGHAGVEAMDMLGYLVPVGYQKMVWKDGPVSEAFRAAQSNKVVLMLDELLRIPQRELSLLLTALAPDRGVYRLRTGRIKEVVDDVAIEEVLEVPVENLCVVATTNVGSDYAVDEIDPALAERFVVVRKDTTVAGLKSILTELAKTLGMPAKSADGLVKFFTKMTEAQQRGVVRHVPTVRTLSRAMALAETADRLADAVEAHSLLWVARTSEGKPVPQQVEAVKKLIASCIK